MATIDFTTLNTNKTPNKKGQQYLDKQEVENAKKLGCVWAEEGQTEVEFNNAMRDYFIKPADPHGLNFSKEMVNSLGLKPQQNNCVHNHRNIPNKFGVLGFQPDDNF